MNTRLVNDLVVVGVGSRSATDPEGMMCAPVDLNRPTRPANCVRKGTEEQVEKGMGVGTRRPLNYLRTPRRPC